MGNENFFKCEYKNCKDRAIYHIWYHSRDQEGNISEDPTYDPYGSCENHLVDCVLEMGWVGYPDEITDYDNPVNKHPDLLAKVIEELRKKEN